MTKPVFRFAPSPNGRLHLGHAYSALLNADFATRFGGQLLLRIEDIDVTRCRPAFEDAIYDDLAWLGLTWERPVRRQSEHFETYRTAASSLRQRGLIYPCFCSRKDIADEVAQQERAEYPVLRDPDGAPLYPGTCRSLDPEESEHRMASGESHSWRIDMDKALASVSKPLLFHRFDKDGRLDAVQARPERWGDAVIVRKDVPTSYHLSVVIDDALQGVTHVVRGRDLEASTDLHVLLQTLLGLPTPLYHHHELVLDRTGDKLAKSRQSEPLAELRARGMQPEDVRRKLGFPPQPMPST